MTDQSGEWITSGPDWNPDVVPIKYAGTDIRWSAEHFDSVVIPLIVTTKHVFWDMRVTEFAVTDHLLEIIVGLPSMHGPAGDVVSFAEGDISPADIALEMTDMLNAVAREVLSETWRYRIVFRQRERSEEFEGELACGD